MRAPRAEKRLPGHLAAADVTRLFRAAEAQAAPNTLAGTRDLMILELLYGSGMRLSELHALDLADLDLLGDQVKVRGKGRKERIVPLTRAAVAAVRRYETPTRGGIARPAPHPPTGVRSSFPHAGGVLSRRGIQKIVHEMLESAALEAGLSAHSLRHSFATHLLDGGGRSDGGQGAPRPRFALDDADLHAHLA